MTPNETPHEKTLEDSRANKQEEKYDQKDLDLEALVRLDFDGVAKLKKGRAFSSKSLDSEIIQILTKNSDEITEEIKRKIKQEIPVGFDINVEIEFRPGSVEFLGFVMIIDALGKLGDSVGGAKVIIDAIKLIINRTIKREIETSGSATVQSIKTNISLNKLNKDSIHVVTKFLWWCAGASYELLRTSPTDKARFQCIGVAVLTISLLAFFSGGYAIYTMFEGSENALSFAAALGLLWSIIVFNFDRSIVSSIRKETSSYKSEDRVPWWNQLVLLAPRLILAVFIGLTISKPIELTLFHDPIMVAIDKRRLRESAERNQESKRANENYQGLIRRQNQLSTEIPVQEKRVEDSKIRLSQESDGSGGTMKRGYGTIAKIKEGLLKPEVDRLILLQKEQAELQNKQKEMDSDINAETEKFKNQRKNDFLTRLDAFGGIMYGSTTPAKPEINLPELVEPGNRVVYWASWAILLLMISIELLPVFIKLLAPPGVYDARLNEKIKAETKEIELRKEAVVEEANYNKDLIVHEAQTRYRLRCDDVDIKRDAQRELIKRRSEIIRKYEEQLDKKIFISASRIRQRVLNQEFASLEDAMMNGHEYNFEATNQFEDFYLHLKKKLSINQIT